MQLCFDATRFGCGLDGAIELAHLKGLSCVEFSFAPFSTSSKTAQSGCGLDDKEKSYLKQVAQLSQEKGITFACLNLDYCLLPTDKKSVQKLFQMLAKLAKVGQAIGCNKISFGLLPAQGDEWKSTLADQIQEWQESNASYDVKLLLRLATAQQYRGQSLKGWSAMEPQDWRDLLSMCPGLSLSFSPGDCVWLGIDYLQILSGFASALEHIEVHDVEINRSMLADSGMFGPLWWRYRLPGKGQVDWSQLIEALKLYDFKGTFSIHLDDEFVPNDTESLEHALDAGIKLLEPLVRD